VIRWAITPADGAVHTFFFEIAMNSQGLTKVGASHKSKNIVGSNVSTGAPAATDLTPRGIGRLAFVDAPSVVASDTDVCQKFMFHISLYQPPVSAVCI